MRPGVTNPIVHLELRTDNLPRACAFYTQLFGWCARTIHLGAASYLTLDLSERMQGGVVERESGPSIWLPYVEVDDIALATERARQLGAVVTVESREGPAGWRSVLVAPDGGEIALWQPKG